MEKGLEIKLDSRITKKGLEIRRKGEFYVTIRGITLYTTSLWLRRGLRNVLRMYLPIQKGIKMSGEKRIDYDDVEQIEVVRME